MTECQGCGAWNDASRTLCVLCAAPLAETDEWDDAAQPPPLPPLPDGGLGASMPSWLREPPAPLAIPLGPPPTLPAPPDPPAHAAPHVLGPRADPRTFLSEDDFPRWLRDLAAHRLAPAPPPTRLGALPVSAPAPSLPAIPAEHSPRPDPSLPPVIVAAAPADAERPAPLPTMPAEPEPSPVLAPLSIPDPPPPAPAASRHERRREPWEALLLAAVLIAIIAGALWTLAANGVIPLGP